MDSVPLHLILTLVVSLVITGVLIPRILVISFKKNLFDEPDERKIHKVAVPRLGGIAFIPVIFLTMAAMVVVNRLATPGSFMAQVVAFDPLALCSGICAVMVVYFVGVADDLIGVKYRAKFVAQLLAALFLVGSGCWIHNLDGFLGIYEMEPWAGITLSVVVIVFIMNALNLIDGIDGLASGLSIIALCVYAMAFWMAGMMMYALVCAATIGTLIPFFYYNVFGDTRAHKKIFMGDTGSLTMGFMLSFMALHLCDVPSGDINGWEPDAFVVAFTPLVIPCFDVLRVFGTRIAHHINPFTPDRTHIHHKLLDCGLSQRGAMLIIVTLSAVLTAANVALARYINITWLVAADLAVVLGLNQALEAIAARRRPLHLSPEEQP